MSIWSPKIGETIFVAPEAKEEVKQYDNSVVA